MTDHSPGVFPDRAERDAEYLDHAEAYNRHRILSNAASRSDL